MHDMSCTRSGWLILSRGVDRWANFHILRLWGEPEDDEASQRRKTGVEGVEGQESDTSLYSRTCRAVVSPGRVELVGRWAGWKHGEDGLRLDSSV